MKLGRRGLQGTAAVVVGMVLAGSALAQVTTRFVTAGGAATSVKILPGGSTSMDVRVDAPATTTIGTGFRISQTAPASSGFISITGRSFVGSPYSDLTFGVPDATVLLAANALLDPDTNVNLGSSTAGPAFTPTAAGSNILAVNLTLTAAAGTPLGTYTIGPTSAVSFVTAAGSVNYPMAGAFDIVVGRTLTVTKLLGTGTGTVKADVGTIDCGATCSDIYPGTVVTLTATPSLGSAFTGWTDAACLASGTGTCAVTVDAAKTVNARFDLNPQTLTVSLAGTGTGTVTDVPLSINCSPTCAHTYAANTVVTLTATPAVSSTFTGWSGALPAGACSGTGTCVVTMSQAQNVTATFALKTFNLTVSKAGNGSGTVTSQAPNLGLIDCGAICVHTFNYGTSVVLQAAADAGNNFTGWSGGSPVCSGTGLCTVSITAAQTVTATFIDPTPPTTSVPIPTLNEWMLALLALALGSVGVVARRRRS